jgi:hypothetical protein
MPQSKSQTGGVSGSHNAQDQGGDAGAASAAQSSADNHGSGTGREHGSETHATGELKDEDFSEAVSDEEKAIIKEVARDDDSSKPKSHASILVEQVMHARQTFDRSLGSLFTSAFTAGMEIGFSLFVILSVFALLSELMPSQYAITLASLLYPLGFIIVVIGQSLLFNEQTSLLSLPVLNKLQPLSKLLRLWGIVIVGNIAGGCLFAALMIGLGIRMALFSVPPVPI